MTNVEKVATARCRHLGFVIDSSFVTRPPRRRTAKAGHSSFLRQRAFTLLEVLVVITIMIILAGLVLSTFGYMQKKGARARAETEIAAMSAACESYKADNAIYPRDNATNGYTDTLDARQNIDPSQTVYQNASLYLYEQLSGDMNANLQPPPSAKIYFSFKPQMLDGTRDGNGNLTSVTYIRDPFGNSYGYSTANQSDAQKGYNPTFDLWSTAGAAPSPTPAPPATQQDLWIKNW
jgi:prepilin-type N-terminal cleavage/methylation domain-containing protein